MKKLLVLSLAFVSLVAQANIKVDMQVVVGDQQTKNECLFDAASQEWTMQQESLVFAAVATEKEDNKVGLKLTVSKKDAEGKLEKLIEGTMDVIADTPALLSFMKKADTEAEQQEWFKLRILATK